MSDASKYDTPIRGCASCNELFNTDEEGQLWGYSYYCDSCSVDLPKSKHGEEPEDFPNSER